MMRNGAGAPVVESARDRLIVYALLLAAVAVAAALRLPGLGNLGLYGDEDLSAFAVRGLLDDGYPHMPSGMSYWRGFVYTMSAAASATVVGFSEGALRLPSALCGIATVPLLFALARRWVGLAPALVAAWLLAVSSWHVDMSREARMYAMFLMCFVASMYAFDRGFLDPRSKLRPVWAATAIALAALSVSLHEIGVVIVPLWLLAVVGPTPAARRAWPSVAAASAVAASWYLYVKATRFVLPGSAGGAPPAAGRRSGLGSLLDSLHIAFQPDLRLPSDAFGRHPYLTVFALSIVVVLAFAGARHWHRQRPLGRLSMLGPPALALPSAAALFGVTATLAASAMLVWPGRLARRVRERPSLATAALLPAGMAALLWAVYAATAWQGDGPMEPDRWRSIVKSVLNWPAQHYRLYLEAFPPLALLVALATAAWAIRGGAHDDDAGRVRRYLFLALWIPLFALGVTREWIALRYSLAVYPFFLLVAARASVALVRRAGRSRLGLPATAALTACLLVLVPWPGGQHDIWAASRWSRLTYGEPVSELIHGFPFHPDHRGAGLFLARRIGPTDVVIAMDAQQVRFYAGRVDYWLMDSRNTAPFVWSEAGELRDIYTGSRVLNDLDALERVVAAERGSRVWIVTSGELAGPLGKSIPSGVREWLEERTDHVAFEARDRATRVYLLDAASPPEAG